ncbi:protein C3orf33 homolog isoform X1 [Mus musculus]|uniref:protein C3orf33 homolog isoform X1 n=1 Tax=Mus musculus TaxID=10090 RepID=UPI0011AE9060|nr:protein C3orf33 homolog isoform X1 [Mus musculus]
MGGDPGAVQRSDPYRPPGGARKACWTPEHGAAAREPRVAGAGPRPRGGQRGDTGVAMGRQPSAPCPEHQHGNGHSWDNVADKERPAEEPRGVLLVKLAGVELTESGKVWLQAELKPSQLLWFQLLGKEDSALFCYLLVNKGGYFNVNLNEEILRRGLGKTVLVKGLNYDSKTHWKIHRNLLKAELTALKKGEGIWKEESEKESYFRKLKDSWRERWTKDNDLKPAGADLGSTKDSYHDSRRRASGKGKDSVSNYSFFLKLREFVSRLHFWRKG